MTGEVVVVNRQEKLTRLDPLSVMPAVVQQAGGRTEERFLEFFALAIRNANTRMTLRTRHSVLYRRPTIG